jgi:mono/diheme cytochrome c family protein
MLRQDRLVLVVLAAAMAGPLVSACTKGSQSSNQGSNAMATAAGNAMMMAMGDAVHGKEIFTRKCASCHGATGREGSVGPSLTNEKSRKNKSQTMAWIKNPQPPMPPLYPSELSDKDLVDVVAYVQSL